MQYTQVDRLARIDPEICDALHRKYESNPLVQQLTASDGIELLGLQDLRRESAEREFGNGPNLCSLGEILMARPEIIHSHRQFQRSFFGLTWTEHLRFASEEELKFLERVREIGNGRFLEVMQVTAITPDGKIEVSYDLSGGMEVNEQTMNDLLDRFRALDEAMEVVLIHPHPDEFALTRLPRDIPIDETTPSLLFGGGISSLDVRLADRVWEERCKKGCKLEILAVNERGLTFSYVAGNSKQVE